MIAKEARQIANLLFFFSSTTTASTASRRLLMLKALCVTGLLLSSCLTSFGQVKRRVAVLDFNYAAVKSNVQAIFGTNQDIGKGITDLLINKLVNDGVYSVIERQATGAIVGEQNFSNGNRADSNSAAKIGKLLGVDAIIIGDVTQFGREDQNTNVGGVAGTLNRYGLPNMGFHKTKAIVGITARLIDINTGEILASVSGEGTSQRSGTDLLGGASTKGTATHLDMGSANFNQTIIGEAVKAAVLSAGANLDAQASRLPAVSAPTAPPKTPVTGLVADVSGNNLVLNVGSTQGIKVGDVLNVTHVGRMVRDPVTGKPLHAMEDHLGSVTITSVDAGSSLGTFSGSALPKVGDTVKPK